MSDWGHEAEDLFREARRELSPRPGERDRVRTRLAAQLGAGMALSAGSIVAAAANADLPASNGAGAAATTGSVSLVVKIVAPVIIVAAIGAASMLPRLLAARAPTPIAPAATSPIAVRSAAPAATISASPDDAPPTRSISVEDLPSATVRAVPRPSASPPRTAAESESARDEEAKLIGELDAAVRAGDVARASRLASDHERRFPNGLLAEEREGARVLARCSSHPDTGSAHAFLRSHPRSPMRTRILAACGAGDDADRSPER